MEFFTQYSYLIACLFGIPMVVLVFIFGRHQRQMMLISGLLLTIFSPHAILHNYSYWTPIRLFQLPYGIEDMICCFSLGSVLWYFSIFPFRDKIQYHFQTWVFIKRLIPLLTILGVTWFICWFSGTGPVTAAIMAQTVVLIIILYLMPSLRTFVINAIILYPPYYLFILFLTGWIIPGFFNIWDGTTLWGPRFCGLPLDEYIWIFTFAPFWVAITTYSSKVQIIID